MLMMINSISLFSVIKYHKIHYNAFHNHFFVRKNKSLFLKNGIDIKKEHLIINLLKLDQQLF